MKRYIDLHYQVNRNYRNYNTNMVLYCCVCNNNCRNNKDVTFFRFPSNPEMRFKWMKNISASIEDFQPASLKSSRVCSDHFTADQLVHNKIKTRLLKSALPTKFACPGPSSSSSSVHVPTHLTDKKEHSTKEINKIEIASKEIDKYKHSTEENDKNELALKEIYKNEHPMKEIDQKDHTTKEINLTEHAPEKIDENFSTTGETVETLVPLSSDDLSSEHTVIDDENIVIAQNEESIVDNSSSDSNRKNNILVKDKPYSDIGDHSDPAGISKDQVSFFLRQLYHVKTFNKKCPVCEMEFWSSDDLLKHEQIHYQPRIFVCPSCDKEFKTAKRLKVHSGKYHIKRYTCNLCSFKTRRLWDLQKHKFVHTREKKYFCKQCPFSTHRPFYMDQHVKIMHSKLKIEALEKKELKKEELKKAKEKVGPKVVLTEFAEDIEILENSDKKYKCKICEKQFPFNYKVVEHIRRHKGVKPFSCDICSYRSVNKEIMKAHKATHSEERNYPCNLCSFKAKNHGMLYHHKRNKHKPINQSEKTIENLQKNN